MHCRFLPTTDSPRRSYAEEAHADCRHSRQVIRVMKSENLYVFEPRASKRPALDWRSKAQKSRNPSIAHPRVWLMGDAMHVMLPNRGMGGNQAMLDTTVIEPLITQLNESAKTRGAPSTSEIAAALRVYEQEMIPRAFYWVEASGGTSPVVSCTMSASDSPR
jgi:2-polyprenyl-6-methoxyphenol hydroxylase-like FAD-dependent oxidoreductase